MILKKILFLLCFPILLFSCGEEKDSAKLGIKEKVDSPAVLFSKGEAKFQYRNFENKDYDSTFFECVIVPGSTVMIISEHATIYRDTSCSETETVTTLLRGDKVRVKESINHSADGYYQPIYKVILEEEGEQLMGYMKDKDLAFYFKSLPDGRTVLSGFSTPYNDHQNNKFQFKGLLLILDERLREERSITFPLTDTLEYDNGEVLFIEAGLEGEVRYTKNFGDQKLLILMRTYYNMCGYYSDDRFFIESQGTLRSLPAQSVLEAGENAHGYQLIWPGEPEGAPDKISVKIFRKDYVYGPNDQQQLESDSTLIRYGWDEFKGVTSIDTIYK